MAVAAAIGVGGLDEENELPTSNLQDENRLSNRLRNKSIEVDSSMHNIRMDSSFNPSIPSEIGSSSAVGGIIGEINRSIEKMSLNLEDALSVPCQQTGTGQTPNEPSKNQSNGVSFTTLSTSTINSTPYACTNSNTNRRGSDWTTVSTEGYGSICESDPMSTVASRRTSDISVSSFSQVIFQNNWPYSIPFTRILFYLFSNLRKPMKSEASCIASLMTGM